MARRPQPRNRKRCKRRRGRGTPGRRPSTLVPPLSHRPVTRPCPLRSTRAARQTLPLSRNSRPPRICRRRRSPIRPRFTPPPVVHAAPAPPVQVHAAPSPPPPVHAAPAPAPAAVHAAPPPPVHVAPPPAPAAVHVAPPPPVHVAPPPAPVAVHAAPPPAAHPAPAPPRPRRRINTRNRGNHSACTGIGGRAGRGRMRCDPGISWHYGTGDVSGAAARDQRRHTFATRHP